MGYRSLLVIVILVFGTLFSMLYVSNILHSRIPTLPTITEDQAIEIMKADIQSRVVADVSIFFYPRDARDPEIAKNPLPLIYYREEDNMAFRIDGTTHSIVGSCVPSIQCFLSAKIDLLDSIAGRLSYFIDGAYSGEENSSPAYYYIDALNGAILWSYIGEDVYPELNQPEISQDDAIRIVEIDFRNRQSDHDRITGIIVNQTSGYVPFSEFGEKNLKLPLVYVHPNVTLIHITANGSKNMGECNSGLFAYCGYLEPYYFDYKGRLVYGVEVLLWHGDVGGEAKGEPFLYVVDAVDGKIVDSTFLRTEHYTLTQDGEKMTRKGE